MTRSSTETPVSRCRNCTYEAPAGGDEWDSVESPPLGVLTRCPECGSTDVMTGM